ncbi:MAG: hypothetical protein AABY05_00425 [Nanoarchaeota archaeon]
MSKEIRECFEAARKDEEKGKKHKGLLVVDSSIEKAKEYLDKARDSLKFCEMYKRTGSDYKIPEEWYYSLYYCALAILCKFGVETRSQRCTALFVKYVKEKGLIDYDDEFINKIIVYKDKSKKNVVDEREEARYGSKIKIKKVEERYDEMMELCKKAISQAEDIIYSDKELKLPKELLEN